MKAKILLGSGGIATEERRRIYTTLVRGHFSECNEILFIPYASNDHESYTKRMQSFLGPQGPKLVGIEACRDSTEAVRNAEAIYVGGGNSFLLIRDLHEKNLLDEIRVRVLNGMPYLGVSAGSNVACPSVMTTNDMPIVHTPSLEALGIVPFQINPHYHPGKILFMNGEDLSMHYGETRAQRIAEFHKQNSTPVLGMWEGSFVHWDGDVGSLTGRATALVADKEPLDLFDGSKFDSSLSIL